MRCFWLLCLSLSLYAQTVDISYLSTSTVSLAGQWKFHPGDDTRWADPNFDDSGWELVRVPLTLNQQGYPDFIGFGWYRLRIQWKKQDGPPDLALGSVMMRSVGEVFANGISVGRFGSFPPHARVYISRPVFFTLGHQRWSSDGVLVLAVRVWKDPRSAVRRQSGLYEPAPEIGLPIAIENRRDASYYALLKEYSPDALICCVELILAIYLLALALIQKQKSEYFWFGLAFCVHAINTILPWVGQSTFALTWGQFYLLLEPTTPLFGWLLFCGLQLTFRASVRRVTQFFFPCTLLLAIIDVVLIAEIGILKFKYILLDPMVWLYIAGHLIVLIFLLRHLSARFGEARWLAVSVGVFVLADMFVANGPGRHQNIESIVERIAFAGSLVTFGYFLTRRFGQAQAEGERLHTEMRAAQEIQSLFLPARSLPTPGFRVETAYLPAQEVGGDFFQIATATDGSLLLAIGDVSGKGVHAALTVSLVVGLWKEITASVFSPAEILARLNRHLADSMKGGFVTCLCAHLTPNGCVTLANAGHLAPYLNGTELTTQNGLPLGVMKQSEYEESQYLLSPDDTLVFVSDGIVEARDKSRDLFGFECLQQALSEHLEADAIARLAQQFGQEDDITVISISRQILRAEPAMQTQIVSTAV